jgi:hypothetical protein
MNLYRITRPDDAGWDEFEGAVVAAVNEADARNIHPNGDLDSKMWDDRATEQWCRPEQVIVEFIGYAKDGTKRGVILSDFNAG